MSSVSIPCPTLWWRRCEIWGYQMYPYSMNTVMGVVARLFGMNLESSAEERGSYPGKWDLQMMV